MNLKLPHAAVLDYRRPLRLIYCLARELSSTHWAAAPQHPDVEMEGWR
jgi:hypothetical protein